MNYKVNAETSHIANLRLVLDLWIIEDLCRSANMETKRMN
jgi:hypothetical protein